MREEDIQRMMWRRLIKRTMRFIEEQRELASRERMLEERRTTHTDAVLDRIITPVFWLLNGLDKVFNGKAWYGVTRNELFIEYFARFRLPSWTALAALHGFALWETALGVMFAAGLFGDHRRPAIRIAAFQGSLWLFACFIACDILLGERGELWEHCTYIMLLVITFQQCVGERLHSATIVEDATLAKVLRSPQRLPNVQPNAGG